MATPRWTGWTCAGVPMVLVALACAGFPAVVLNDPLTPTWTIEEDANTSRACAIAGGGFVVTTRVEGGVRARRHAAGSGQVEWTSPNGDYAAISKDCLVVAQINVPEHGEWLGVRLYNARTGEQRKSGRVAWKGEIPQRWHIEDGKLWGFYFNVAAQVDLATMKVDWHTPMPGGRSMGSWNVDPLVRYDGLLAANCSRALCLFSERTGVMRVHDLAVEEVVAAGDRGLAVVTGEQVALLRRGTGGLKTVWSRELEPSLLGRRNLLASGRHVVLSDHLDVCVMRTDGGEVTYAHHMDVNGGRSWSLDGDWAVAHVQYHAFNGAVAWNLDTDAIVPLREMRRIANSHNGHSRQVMAMVPVVRGTEVLLGIRRDTIEAFDLAGH
jgi:hypothetical protein